MNNDPINLVDVDGKNPILAAGAIGFTIGFITGYSIEKKTNPNSTFKDRFKAGLEGGVITGSSSLIGALSPASTLVGGVLTAAGLSYNFLSGPGEAGVKMEDLGKGIQKLKNPEKNLGEVPCPSGQ